MFVTLHLWKTVEQLVDAGQHIRKQYKYERRTFKGLGKKIRRATEII